MQQYQRLASTLVPQARALTQTPLCHFSYGHGEIRKLEMQVRRKLHVLRMFGELKEFDYEPPNMAYDKKTGEVKILEKKGANE